MLNGFGTVINALSKRAKPYLPQVGVGAQALVAGCVRGRDPAPLSS
jgi:hypothetical protein